MLPKSYRRKARVILEAGDIPFQRKSLRVFYNNGTEMGSHLLDLLQYILAPSIIKEKIKNPPPDLKQFQELVGSRESIPASIFSNKKKKKSSIKWISIY